MGKEMKLRNAKKLQDENVRKPKAPKTVNILKGPVRKRGRPRKYPLVVPEINSNVVELPKEVTSRPIEEPTPETEQNNEPALEQDQIQQDNDDSLSDVEFVGEITPVEINNQPAQDENMQQNNDDDDDVILWEDLVPETVLEVERVEQIDEDSNDCEIIEETPTENLPAVNNEEPIEEERQESDSSDVEFVDETKNAPAPTIDPRPNLLVGKRTFMSRIRLSVCGRKFDCKQCSRSFDNHCELLIHRKNHEKSDYRCNKCGRRYKYLASYENHACSVDCMLCLKPFCNKSNLVTHMSNVHGIGHVMTFKCDFCGATYKSKRNVDTHMRVHMKKTPFNCEVCRKGFANKGSLKVHLMNHEKPVTCQYCRKNFKPRSLYYHLKKCSSNNKQETQKEPEGENDIQPQIITMGDVEYVVVEPDASISLKIFVDSNDE